MWSLDIRPSPHGITGPVRTLGRVGLPDGDEVLVTAGHEAVVGYTVQMWEPGTGRPRGRVLAGAADRAQGCVRTSDGAAVVTVTPDGNDIQLWDLGSDQAQDVELAGHTGPLTVLTCLNLHDGTPIVITGGRSVRAWRADTGHPYGPALPLRAASRRTMSCLQLPDETLVVVYNDRGRMEAWDAATGHHYGFSGLNWSAIWSGWSGVMDCVTLQNGKLVAVNAFPRTKRCAAVIWAWNLDTFRAYGGRVHLRASSPEAIACTRLPDGAVIAAVGGDQGRDDSALVEIVDPLGGRTLHEIAVPDHVMDLGFTAEHQLIVRTYLDVAVYDLP
jgi:WD40 repeat protein